MTIIETDPNVEYDSTTIAKLNADIEPLAASNDKVEATRLESLFESAIVILTLAKDGIIEEDAFVELAELCVRTCHMFGPAPKERISEAIRNVQVEDLARTVRHIDSTARERKNGGRDLQEHRLAFTKERAIALQDELLREVLRTFDGDWKRCDTLDVGEIELRMAGFVDADLPLSPTLKMAALVSRFEPSLQAPTPSVLPDGNLNHGAQAASPLPRAIDFGTSSPVPPSNTNHVHNPTPILDSGQQALQRLVSGAAPQEELPSLVETVVSHIKAADISNHLQGTELQTLVDVLNQALDEFDPALGTRNEWVKSLYEMCAEQTLYPTSMRLELSGNTMDNIQCRGGFGMVSKCEYRGREVAVKVLRPRGLGSREISKRFWREVITWKAIQHPNILPLLGVAIAGDQIAMVSEWMAGGNIKEFIETHPNANRYKLLADATKGLVHIHSQGMIHRDLKGVNVLVDQNGRACLADFGLLTIEPDATDTTPWNSFQGGGTIRWMGPELFYLEKFGLAGYCLMKSSDCYALGMVIYEILSGKVPFHRYKHYKGIAAIWKVLNGERPERPQGEGECWFTDDIWNTLECCWKPTPSDRPSAEDVLHRLEEASMSWAPAQTMARPVITNPDPDSRTGVDLGGERSSAPQTISPQLSQAPLPGGPTSPQSVDHSDDSGPPLAPNSEGHLWRLVCGTVPQDELPFLIEMALSDLKATDIVELCTGDGAQRFVDVIDQALDSCSLPSRIRKKCMRSSYKVCAGHALLPGSLHVELPVDPMDNPVAYGGCAEVFKCYHSGREVAVKVLRVHATSDFMEITDRFCKEVIPWKALRHPNVVPLLGAVMTDGQFAMVSEWMLNGTIREFITANPASNLLELSADVARGLVHLHHHGIVHGDLKGANILVDKNGRACLADFGLIRITSDTTSVISSELFLGDGTVRWMAPELLNPEGFGFEDGRPTRPSDSYALGMVVYEVLTNKVPFSQYENVVVVRKVIEGERPPRPQGTEGVLFTVDIWITLQQCWESNPSDRPDVKDVLHRLEVSRSLAHPPEAIASPPISDWGDKTRREQIRPLGMNANNSISLEESGQILDEASPCISLPQEAAIRRQSNHEYPEVPS
ncbi:kinase-like domain-containing protein [Thelephora terrestris]|uniref:Kinase-like domain-containing protein n=1 Tax=Thelephora terrestris TaxID=56493 RepID=A0A9P6L3J8_9AGAM|nr:kinase-like domain-containing protein [Thelephora terrestris]